jgi:hypothetical protein
MAGGALTVVNALASIIIYTTLILKFSGFYLNSLD